MVLRSDPGRVWRLFVVLSATVVPLGTLALVLAMVASGADLWQPPAVVAAAAVLHVAAWQTAARPVGAFVAASGAMLVLALVPMPGWSSGVLIPSSLCFLLAEWRLVETGPRRWVRPTLVVAVVGVALTAGLAAVREPLDAGLPGWLTALEAALLLLTVTAVWALARTVRSHRERAAVEEEERLTLARRSERAEIRRDLHDVIAHSLTLMVAQAEAARVGTTEPTTAAAFAQVADTGRGALAGLRGMLRVLDAAPTAAGDVVPSLDGLSALVAAAETPLHRVTLVEDGVRRHMGADAETALVRLVQEGITNALRHLEPPLAVGVRLDWAAAADGGPVLVEVRDDGGAGPRTAAGSGTGLQGITRRVEAAGGRLEVSRGAGWALTAALPTLGPA